MLRRLLRELLQVLLRLLTERFGSTDTAASPAKPEDPQAPERKVV